MSTLDEVSSLVVDIGSRYLRVGYSGDERPSLVMPSMVGVESSGKHHLGDLALYNPVGGMEIRPVLNATEGIR